MEIENSSSSCEEYASMAEQPTWIYLPNYDAVNLVYTFVILTDDLDLVGQEFNLRFVASDDAYPTNYAYDEFTLTFSPDT